MSIMPALQRMKDRSMTFFQFTDVAGPIMRHQQGKRFTRDARDGFAMQAVEAPDELFDWRYSKGPISIDIMGFDP